MVLVMMMVVSNWNRINDYRRMRNIASLLLLSCVQDLVIS